MATAKRKRRPSKDARIRAVKRAKAMVKRWPTRKVPCTPPNICKYLTALGTYLAWLDQDYTDLRIAMCNVESQAFSGLGVPAKRFPPCGGGPAGDPVPPPTPPKWT